MTGMLFFGFQKSIRYIKSPRKFTVGGKSYKKRLTTHTPTWTEKDKIHSIAKHKMPNFLISPNPLFILNLTLNYSMAPHIIHI